MNQEEIIKLITPVLSEEQLLFVKERLAENLAEEIVRCKETIKRLYSTIESKDTALQKLSEDIRNRESENTELEKISKDLDEREKCLYKRELELDKNTLEIKLSCAQSTNNALFDLVNSIFRSDKVLSVSTSGVMTGHKNGLVEDLPYKQRSEYRQDNYDDHRHQIYPHDVSGAPIQ